MEEWAEEKENEKEEIKHGTKKGWTLGLVRSFPKIHMAINLWCAPVWCWILTVSGSTGTRRSLRPTQRCTLLGGPTHGHEKLTLGRGKINHSVIFFLICFTGKSFPWRDTGL